MTLIVAVRCTDGIAIAADSQETVGEYRRTVQKLSPLQLGSVSAIVAGAGDADLIESFTTTLGRRLQSSDVGDLAGFVHETESELARFNTSAASSEDTDMRLFVAASCPRSGEYDIWSSRNATLVPMGRYGLAGWEEPLYDTTLRRLCTTEITLPQGILATLYTILMAEETSNYVRGPIQAATIRANGIAIEDSNYIRLMQDRLREYEQHVNRVFMNCADTGINLVRFENMLVDFCGRAMSLHKAQIDSVLDQMLRQGLNSGTGDPYPRIPPGFSLTIAAGDMDDVYTEGQKATLLKNIREAANRDMRPLPDRNDS